VLSFFAVGTVKVIILLRVSCIILPQATISLVAFLVFAIVPKNLEKSFCKN
jgi:hypothetical protein